MAGPSRPTLPISLSVSVLSRIQHLDLTDKVTHKDTDIAGHGGYSEVFKGRCRVDDGNEVRVAIKRLRFYLKDTEMNKVRG